MNWTRAIATRERRWAWISAVLLAGLTPFLLFPGGWRTWALIGLPFIWLGNRLFTGHFVRRTAFDVLLLGLLATVLVSLYATYDLRVSLAQIAGLLCGVSVFYVVVQVGDEPRLLGWLFGAFLLAGIGLSALALLGTQWLNQLSGAVLIREQSPILRGVAGIDEGLNPNEVAGALIWILPALLVLAAWLVIRRQALHSVWGAGRTILLTAIMIGMAGVVTGLVALSQSRAGYLALAATVTVLVLIVSPGRRRWWILGGAAMMAMMAAVAVLPRIAGNSSAQAAATAPGPLDLSTVTLEQRLEIWARAQSVLEDFPVTGIGLGTFRSLLDVFYPLFTVSAATGVNHAHNEFLQAALDLGAGGLVVLMAVYLVSFRLLLRLWSMVHVVTVSSMRYERDTVWGMDMSGLLAGQFVRVMVLSLFGGLLAHLLFGLLDAIVLGSKYGVIWWLLLGLIAAMWRVFGETQREESRSTTLASGRCKV